MRVAATTNLSDPKVMSWDTEFWGTRVANATHLDGLSEWAVENTVGLVCLLIDANDPEQAQKAEEHGFRFMDVRVTLEREARIHKPSSARPVHRKEVESLCAIARHAFPVTRFYADPRLDNERCGELYETWTRTLCRMTSPQNGVVLVVARDDVPVGYVTVETEDDKAKIGLIAVASDYRGDGIGTELVNGALAWTYFQGVDMISVVTQGRNIGALRTFESCGFRIVNTSLWFHKRYA